MMKNTLSETRFDVKFYKEVKKVLKKAKVNFIETELANNRVWIAFYETEDMPIMKEIYKIVGGKFTHDYS